MEGLVHISELSTEPVKRPSDIAKIGDEVFVRIIDIDYDKRRMAFSIRQVTNPDEPKEKEEVEKVEESKVENVIDSSEEKPEEPKASVIPEREKAIKEILKEMKDEANIT